MSNASDQASRITREDLLQCVKTLLDEYIALITGVGPRDERTIAYKETLLSMLDLLEGMEARMTELEQTDGDREGGEGGEDPESESGEEGDIQAAGGQGRGADAQGGSTDGQAKGKGKERRAVPAVEAPNAADGVQDRAQTIVPERRSERSALEKVPKITIPSLGVRRGGHYSMVPDGASSGGVGGSLQKRNAGHAADSDLTGSGPREESGNAEKAGSGQQGERAAVFSSATMLRVMAFGKHAAACVESGTNSETLGKFLEWLQDDEQKDMKYLFRDMEAERELSVHQFTMSYGGRGLAKPVDLEKGGFVQRYIKKNGAEVLEENGIPVPDWLLPAAGL
ncbi:hypothetical protein FRB90_011767 [Tulasnella sp. 427]|nr:hypothetical protein FRB90_011767 [Tulasnella sp. 427]